VDKSDSDDPQLVGNIICFAVSLVSTYRCLWSSLTLLDEFQGVSKEGPLGPLGLHCADNSGYCACAVHSQVNS
jgi:hypothetical protein